MKKLTGLDIETRYITGKKQIVLKSNYVDRLIEVFKKIKKYINIKEYNPPDGQKLAIMIEGAGNYYKGHYYERLKAISISPTWTEAIVHEMAHYFWYRDKELTMDFMNWANKSGYYDKVEEVTDGKVDEKDFEKHINSMYECFVNNNLAIMIDRHKSDSLKGKVTVFRHGMTYLMNSFREMGKDRDLKGKFKLSGTVDTLKKCSDKDITNMAIRMKNVFHTIAESIPLNEVEKSLKESIEILKKDNIIAHKAERMISSFLTTISKREYMRSRGFEYYTKDKMYWRTPTEMFARAVETFIRHKAKAKEDKSPYGISHGKVDPDKEMFRDGKFEELLKKYLGNEVIKSMLIFEKELIKSEDKGIIFYKERS